MLCLRVLLAIVSACAVGCQGGSGAMPSAPNAATPSPPATPSPRATPPAEPEREPDGSAENHVGALGCKPQAPVDIELRARALGGGRYEVTAVATPWADVRDVAIALRADAPVRFESPPASAFAATSQGTKRSMRAVVAVGAAGATITADVRVAIDSAIRPVKIAKVRVGAPEPATVERTRIVVLPGGDRIVEAVR